MRTRQVPHVPFCSVGQPAPKVYEPTNFIRIYTSYLLGGGMIFIVLKSFLYGLPNISGLGTFEDCCLDSSCDLNIYTCPFVYKFVDKLVIACFQAV